MGAAAQGTSDRAQHQGAPAAQLAAHSVHHHDSAHALPTEHGTQCSTGCSTLCTIGCITHFTDGAAQSPIELHTQCTSQASTEYGTQCTTGDNTQCAVRGTQCARPTTTGAPVPRPQGRPAPYGAAGAAAPPPRRIAPMGHLTPLRRRLRGACPCLSQCTEGCARKRHSLDHLVPMFHRAPRAVGIQPAGRSLNLEIRPSSQLLDLCTSAHGQ